MNGVLLTNRIPTLFGVGFSRKKSKTIRASEQGVWAQMLGPFYFLAEKVTVNDLIKLVKAKEEIIFEKERECIGLKRLAQEQADEHFILAKYVSERGNMKNYRAWYIANAPGIMAKENARRKDIAPKEYVKAGTTITVLS